MLYRYLFKMTIVTNASLYYFHKNISFKIVRMNLQTQSELRNVREYQLSNVFTLVFIRLHRRNLTWRADCPDLRLYETLT